MNTLVENKEQMGPALMQIAVKKQSFSEIVSSINNAVDLDDVIIAWNELAKQKYRFPLIYLWFAAEFCRDKLKVMMYDETLDRDRTFFSRIEKYLTYFDNILESEENYRKNTYLSDWLDI